MLEAIFLGVLQGLTEFLPISSSAHIRIAGALFGTAEDPGATFTAITQIGTELAVLIFFRREIFAIIKALFQSIRTRRLDSQARLGRAVIIGSVPIVIIGFLLQDTIRTTFRSLWLISIVLILFAVILGVADRYGRSSKSLDSLTMRDALAFGLAQSLALIPGVSRSGATIAFGRARGYDRVSALRFSFFLALPAVFGSGFFELYKSLSDPSTPTIFTLPQTFVATAIAFVVGYAVIRWLMRFVSTKSFAPFVIYRIALGISLLIALQTSLLKA